YRGYRIGVPSNGKYLEVFNSDAKWFGGSNQLNPDAIRVYEQGSHNLPYSMEITVPPLGVAIFMKQTKKRRRGMVDNWTGKDA
ncbi:MAG TPA: alpha amylase C-terminal domain-containing protein, partial [Bacillales bacterium]|nr:alpha amylase C-terminal domain-containing protein [Bacillales bacterium]